MTISLPSATQPAHLCYTRQAWAGTWIERPLLECLFIAENAAPSHGSARFSYRYGIGMLPAIGSSSEDSALTTKTRPDLKGHYVRVDVTGFGSWWGIITDVDDSAHGLISTVPSGVQNLTAMSLTWLLEHAPAVTQSKCKTAGGNVTINRAIPFNGGTGNGESRGSRVTWKNYDPASELFCSQFDSENLQAWKASSAIRYLLENFSPKNASDAVLIQFVLSPLSLQYLDYELPQVDYHGSNLWQILGRLIDRRRGLVWYASVNSGSNQVVINVVSQNASPLMLDDSIVPANSNQQAYNFETAVNVKSANVATTLHSYYDQIVVEGERVGSVFTVRPQTNFEPDWTEAEQTEYDSGASSQTGFSALSNGDKEASNMDARAVDKLSAVYSWWRLKRDWNGRGDTGPDSAEVGFVFPVYNDDGTIDSSKAADVFMAGLRIETYVPLRAGTDYETVAITAETGESDSREADYLAPIVFFQADPIVAADTDDAGWVHAERLNQSADAGSSKRQYQYSIDVSVREDACGFVFRTVGAPQHFIASDLFTSQGSYEDVPSAEGIESDQWAATVYVLADDYCSGVWPPKATLANLDLVRQLRLKVQGAHLDYVVPGTVVGVKYGALKITEDGGHVRDDRKRLRDLAKLAFAWYGVKRRTLNLSFDGMVSGFSIGTLITTIGSGATLETINTVVTSVSYDLKRGATQLHTQFGEMDFAA